MASFKDLEDSLKYFMIQEQSDAHNIKTANLSKYNNLKIWMDVSKYQQGHFYVRVSISEAVFSIDDCTKLNGGLGFEERFVYKWFGRIGIKDRLTQLWASASAEISDEELAEEEQSNINYDIIKKKEGLLAIDNKLHLVNSTELAREEERISKIFNNRYILFYFNLS